MARETKIAMLIGLGVILLIGIIISDHLATVQGTGGGQSIAEFGQRTNQALGEAENPEEARRDAEVAAERVSAELERAIPRPEELDGETEPPSGSYDAPPPQDLRAMRIDPRRASRRDREGDSRQATDAARSASTDASRDLEFSRDARTRSDPEQPEQPPSRASASSETPSAGGQVIHYVEAGESLYDVAEKYLGDGGKWRAIVEANREAVPDPDLVTAGLRLVIPASPDAVPRRAAGRAASESAESEPPKTVKVQPGDTLFEIAKAYLGSGERWREIIAVNDELQDPTDLRSGMSITLPPLNGSAPSNGTDRNRTDTRRNSSGASPQTTYVVQTGDSLARIARRVLGDADRWEDVYQANRERLDDPDDIRPGQTLRIPR